jgi:hypothetical protein
MISYYRKKLITPDLCHLCCCCLLWHVLILLTNEGIHTPPPIMKQLVLELE